MTDREEDKKRIIRNLIVLGICESVAKCMAEEDVGEDIEMDEDTVDLTLPSCPVVKRHLKETTTSDSISINTLDLKTP